MSVTEMRRLAKQNIDRLPPGQLRSVVDFIGYLSGQSEPYASRPAFVVRLSKARRDAKAGKLVAVANLRRRHV